MTNIEHELKFVSLLGLVAIELDDFEGFIIIDKNEQMVGNIQYNKNKDNEILDYIIKINTSKINYVHNDKVKSNYNDDFIYSFDLKNNNEEINKVIFKLGKYPFLEIHKNSKCMLNFRMLFDKIYFNYKSITKKGIIEESVSIKFDNNSDENIIKSEKYIYLLKYYENYQTRRTIIPKREHKLTVSKNLKLEHCVNISMLDWKDNKLEKERNTTTNGTVDEAILKHHEGISSFNYLRYLINEILNFDKEVISVLLEKVDTKYLSFLMFNTEEKENEEKGKCIINKLFDKFNNRNK